MIASPGDIVSRRKGLVLHKGVVVPGGGVLHNTPEAGEHITSFEGFAGGERVAVHRRSHLERRATLERMRAGLPRRRGYDLLANNCEHTVTRVVEGRARSPQLVNWLLGAGVGIAVLMLSRSPTWAMAATAAIAKGRED